CARVHTEFDFW
nr:immunoglobulin heavy chain junction region [Macaca mulatta]MOV50711.1 immunoglobulin heavy chain junction region [Macaca mulatta]MOV52678.1 immunoglobulin heavy chain junction region [Macaca mulatta]